MTYSKIFKEGDVIGVRSKSKGKGFQGVVKRHGFAGVGQATHGQHNRLRAPGSIGAASTPARVFKGMRMAGQTGNARVTIDSIYTIFSLPHISQVYVFVTEFPRALAAYELGRNLQEKLGITFVIFYGIGLLLMLSKIPWNQWPAA